MFVCTECGCLFDEPYYWNEYHPYGEGYAKETWSGCPDCHGNYTEAYPCDCCNEWIDSDYIKIDGNRYCEYCYTKYKLGDE